MPCNELTDNHFAALLNRINKEKNRGVLLCDLNIILLDYNNKNDWYSSSILLINNISHRLMLILFLFYRSFGPPWTIFRIKTDKVSHYKTSFIEQCFDVSSPYNDMKSSLAWYVRRHVRQSQGSLFKQSHH